MQDFYGWTSARARNLAVLAARVSVIGHWLPVRSIFPLLHVQMLYGCCAR